MSARRVAALLALAVSLHVSAATSSVPLAGNAEQAKEIWSVFEHWLAAYSAGDMKGVMAIFDPAVEFSFQGSPDQRYKDLEASYADDFRTRAPGTDWAPKVEEVYADGNLGFVRSVWELRVKNAQGMAEVKLRNKSLDVFRRQPSGAWVIIRSINYPLK